MSQYNLTAFDHVSPCSIKSITQLEESCEFNPNMHKQKPKQSSLKLKSVKGSVFLPGAVGGPYRKQKCTWLNSRAGWAQRGIDKEIFNYSG